MANNASIRAAALTFFIVLPLPSLLLILESVLALHYGQTQAAQILINQITSLAGPVVADLFKDLLAGATSPFSSPWSAFTLVAFSVGGAIGAFAVLRDTMDSIWEVKSAKSQGFRRMVRKRIGPFFVVTILGLIVIAWTGISSVLFRTLMFFSINETMTRIFTAIVQILLSFGLAAMLLALTYKLIPDTKVHWRDVALASIFTGVAFTVTNYVIGTYVETFTVTTVVGAAGSLLIILIWIFTINEIMLFGANMSKVYATTVGFHSIEHLPQPVNSIVKFLNSAQERIENATKGNEINQDIPPESKVKESPEKKEIQPSNEEQKTQEENVEVTHLEAEKKADTVESKNPNEGNVEVTVKIKRPDKKKQAQN